MSGVFFQRQIESLASNFRVIVPDFRGHGESENVLTGHTVKQYAADVYALVTRLGVERPVLLGWSMGVMVAYEYLDIANEDEVLGLVVVEQVPSDFVWPDYPEGVFTAEQLWQTNHELQTEQKTLATEFVDLMLHEPDEETRAWMVREICKCPPAIAGSILLDQTLRDDRALIRRLRIPTLVIFGEDPKMTNPSAGKWIAEQIENSQFQLIAESSHCPFYEKASEFNALVTQFVTNLSS